MGSDVTFSQAQSAALPALPPQSPGVAGLFAFGSTQKEEARRTADTTGFFASHPGRRAERWGRFPTRPEVELNDSRKTRGRASGGLGAAPPVILTGGAVASRPRNSPLPKAPAAPAAFPLTARVSGCTGQDGLMTEARSIPRLWGRFRGNLGHQEGFWHGVCFPYLDNLGLTFGCKNARKSTADAALRGY